MPVRIRPEQDRLVAPVAISLAEAYADPEHAWPRPIYEGDQVVGFVMAGSIPGHELLDSTLWRLNVAAGAQGRGYGRFGSVPRQTRHAGAVDRSCRSATRGAKAHPKGST